jgi:hypothetical protein
MTIDDELLLELIRPDGEGMITADALIVSIVGAKDISYSLEESTYYVRTYGRSGVDEKTEIVRITPDITIKMKMKKDRKATLQDLVKEAMIGPSVGIAFELENDIHWDFQESLRQIKKYKRKFTDTRIIIPNDFKRFAPLYKHEGFRVYLWRAKRRWECLRCGCENESEGPVTPKCRQCKNNSPNEFRLIGLKDTSINEFTHQGENSTLQDFASG